MTSVAYKVRVFNAGTTSYTTSAVAFTLDTLLQAPPTILGPRIRPFEGRTEAQPWTIDVLDGSQAITALIADGNGRAQLMNRWIQVLRNTGGAGDVVIGAGRLTDLMMKDSVVDWRLTVQQETALSGAEIIFNTTNTTRLYPPGPHRNYGPFRAPDKGTVTAVAYYSSGVKQVLMRFNGGGTLYSVGGSWVPLTDLGAEAIKGDLQDLPMPGRATGVFKHLRLRVGNTDYPITSFGTLTAQGKYPTSTGHGRHTYLRPDPNFIGPVDSYVNSNVSPECWIVVSSSTTFAAGSFGFVSSSGSSGGRRGTQYSSAFLHMFTAPPSEATPLHIGGSSGIHPMTLKRQLMNGAYASTGLVKPRISTAAFDNGTTGLERVPMPRVRFRVTGQQPRGDWIVQQLNAPFGVADFIDSSGRIVPKSVWLPNTTSVFGYTFTAANMQEPHPTWTQPGRETITAIRLQYTNEQWVVGGLTPSLVAPTIKPTNAPADFIRVTPTTQELLHDRVKQIGYRPLKMRCDGVHPQLASPFDGGIWPFGPPAPDPSLQALLATLQGEVFQRFGDGPIMGTITALSSADSVEAGDWAAIALGTFPNPATLARGGSRLVQLMTKTRTPNGPVFEYLDAGPYLQRLTAPSVTLALSTISKKHGLKATISGLPTGAQFQLELAKSTGAAAPASTSQLWTRINTSVATTGTYNIGRRPAGSAWWARTRSVGYVRVKSTWHNSTAKITTSGLAAPTIVGVSNIKAQSADLSFTPGETAYMLQTFVDTSTSATFSTANLAGAQSAGGTRFSYFGLTPNTKHKVGVRHTDNLGGYSAAASTTFTTLSSGTPSNWALCPPPVGLYLLGGGT